MSFRLPPPSEPREPTAEGIDSSSLPGSDESEEEEEENWDDWLSDSNVKVETKSLFDDRVFPTVAEAVNHDKTVHNYSLDDTCQRLSLDFHGRVRLINYIRKNNTAPSAVATFQGSEPWLTADEYLIPAIENDPLIQLDSQDWSDSDDESVSDNTDLQRKIKRLEKKLRLAKQSLAEYREMMAHKLELSNDIKDSSASTGAVQTRDDDTHYFDSYAENDIHAVMIQDKVRTSTYAHFILTNPMLFTDATVLDVGCGTGILSLFAARAGAKRVIAVDASNIAEKAEKIIKANGMQDIITIIRGKVEDIQLPEDVGKVDIIISEWMGYALLYESMLDSVLVARDRFLKPGGVMAPSECKIMLGLCDASEVYKDRIGFWEDVYGFDLSTMASHLYDEAIVDVVGPETILSKPYSVKNLFLRDITTRQLDFSNTFTLISTTDRRRQINSFILYFDTFFTPSGDPIPSETEVKQVKDGEAVLAELWPVGGKPAHKRRQSMGRDKDRVTSFSTGPLSTPTHWKQTLFMLREPIIVSEGSIVSGSFTCRKSEENSRELEVEIHYSVKESEESSPSETVVQSFKVR